MNRMTSSTPPAFQPLPGLYEPSAIQQLPDGRFLVVEDEKDHSYSLLTLQADGTASSEPLGPGWFQGGAAIWNLDDLEGLALDSLGYLYGITSHSRNSQGETKKAREQLARFRVEEGRMVKPVVVGGLKPALAAAHPVLAAAAQVADVKSGEGLSIEALDITPDRQRLLIGFRSPLQGGLALIASVDNPTAVFEAGAPPQIGSRLQALDLGGQGIRGMAYVAGLQGYLLIGGPAARTQEAEFSLWFWSGEPAAPARRVTVPGLQGLAHAEGISPALIDGVAHVVIVSDEGDRKEKRCARFALLRLEQLRIAD
ncbi:MAG: hypothetical protein JWR60_3355 [Polaromonas sp.]|nr:hypothetical protein [Polaromonas sp.]